jgi:hypothetical protein
MDEPEKSKETHPLSGVMDFWERVIDDMEATAAEYREVGWDVVELHPGDVTPVPAMLDTAESDEFGLDALVPGDEFETVEGLVADAEFDAYDAYRAERGDVVFLVVAMLAEETETAVTVPLYYRTNEAAPMLDRATEAGEMRVFVRPLSDDRRVIFVQDDPETLLPADDGGGDDAEPASDEAEPGDDD